MGRHCRLPCSGCPAFAHTMRRRRGRLQRPLPRRERLPRSCLRLNVDPWRSSGLPKDKSLANREQEASVRNSLEQSAGSLSVYNRTEFEPRTHLAGLHVQVSTSLARVKSACQCALAFLL